MLLRPISLDYWLAKETFAIHQKPLGGTLILKPKSVERPARCQCQTLMMTDLDCGWDYKPDSESAISVSAPETISADCSHIKLSCQKRLRSSRRRRRGIENRLRDGMLIFGEGAKPFQKLYYLTPTGLLSHCRHQCQPHVVLPFSHQNRTISPLHSIVNSRL